MLTIRPKARCNRVPTLGFDCENREADPGTTRFSRRSVFVTTALSQPQTIMVFDRAITIRREPVIFLKNETEYIEAREAARRLGISQRAIRNFAASGRLESGRDGEGAAARLVVSAASVERLRLERQGRG